MRLRADPNPWVTCPRPNSAARLRLFCIPYAGGGASAFRGWWDELPAQIEVCPIQLPGRENRMAEPLFQRVTPLVQALADGIGPSLAIPFALFGHSAGAKVAFELGRELRRRGAATPTHLFVSGRRAPHIPRSERLYELPDGEFMEKLRSFDGTPEAILQHPELMEIFMPILRADMAVNDAEEHKVEEPLDCPISAFGGLEDVHSPREGVEAWRDHTRSTFTLEMFPGGHFFLHSARAAMLRVMSTTLDRYTSP
jgi:medium-chain acyl-[acyl-carrier-protein] hydrolase